MTGVAGAIGTAGDLYPILPSEPTRNGVVDGSVYYPRARADEEW